MTSDVSTRCGAGGDMAEPESWVFPATVQITFPAAKGSWHEKFGVIESVEGGLVRITPLDPEGNPLRWKCGSCGDMKDTPRHQLMCVEERRERDTIDEDGNMKFNDVCEHGRPRRYSCSECSGGVG